MIRLNKSVLDSNTVLCNEEKLLIEQLVELASNHDGASSGEIAVYDLLMSLMPNGKVCLNDVLYHLGAKKVCMLLSMQERGIRVSDFWYLQ